MSRLIFMLSVGIIMSISLNAQTNSLEERMNTLEKKSDLWNRFKISGYVHFKYQHAQEPGISSFAGGSFAEGVDNRFTFRRGRLKVTYAHKKSKLVLTTENTERKFTLRELYFQRELLPDFYLKLGQFVRPFSWEQIYSSSKRESPERTMYSQVILPNEMEIGAQLTYHFTDFLKLSAGIFNGNNSFSDIDKYKDFIARLETSQPLSDGMQLDAGVSYYYGGLAQGSPYRFTMSEDGKSFVREDSAKYDQGSFAKRQYFGADVQYSVKTGLGKTTLRAEYIFGQQPGSASSSRSPKSAAILTHDVYMRNFDGAAFYLVQQLGKLPSNLFVKYDWYDPNTDIAADDIGANATSSADVKWTTLGVGWNYHWKPWTFTLYYDMFKKRNIEYPARL